MTHQQILEKAIKKAIDGGWKGELPDGSVVFPNREYQFDHIPYGLIFNHDFAKALWGEGLEVDVAIHTNPSAEEGDQPDVIRTTEAWKLHLKNMVIAEDPIKYLGENL